MLERLILGDTLNYSTTVDGYSAADGWVLKYGLVPRTGAGAGITLTSTADGEQHRVQETATATAAWTAGVYSWHSWVEKASEKYSVASGSVQLVANPRTASTGPLDLRTEAEIALDNVRTVIRGKASADVLRYTINGRSLERYGMADLIALEAKLAADVRREQDAARLAAGLGSRRRFFVRLNRG
jgi:hypothetical protein